MKKSHLISLLMLTCATAFLISCSKEEPKIDPRKAILGKWEITHVGGGGDKLDESSLIPYEANGYQEYLADSVTLYYNYNENRFSYEKYWFTDSLLIFSLAFVDDITYEDKESRSIFKYDFIDSNKLRLEAQNTSIFRTSLYKRID